ncbi:MAG: hypothetical protein A3A77_03720 [Candidatus Blackburnbacteria bacterium RIFCSPLOWO2_01_FULL_40_20]|uniref:Uncharacterized protein n=1 Tax=Candidatus Blackburnbacteria bacterium RIFCSPLOWO2_01_FULL_40_20 TaxID=1797519 RepID=A0A1G1VDK9_9BACT|nr:MAG: hypothetical protein A3A77_03720 [Candidatus Blackburnbacteria bacterium RIFCSPLOWO2_01_FULL_40_20]
MPKLAGGRYKKRRRFFRMKRTIGLKVYPGFLQTDIGLNEIHYIQAGFNFLGRRIHGYKIKIG